MIENIKQKIIEKKEVLEKIAVDKNAAFSLLEKINAQKLEVEQAIEQIQLNEAKILEEIEKLEIVLDYLSKNKEEEVIKDEINEQDL